VLDQITLAVYTYLIILLKLTMQIYNTFADCARALCV